MLRKFENHKGKLSISLLVLLIYGISTAAQQPSTAPDSKIAVTLPGEPWELVFDAPGFKTATNGIQPDGRAYLEAQNDSTQVILSVFLERIHGKATDEECAANQSRRLAQKVEYKREGIVTKTEAGMAIVEYTIPEFRGVPVQQKNVFACIAKDDVYADIHLSKTRFKASDQELFSAILNSARFVPKADSSGSTAKQGSAKGGGAAGATLEYLREGSLLFMQQKYAQSIGPYQKALDAERQKRTLPENLWRVLIDNLGMAYGITGDLKQSEATLDYGVSQDPTYPMFYYNLACVAAGRNDKSKTMEFLRKAFSYKANIIPGESMPNPRTDDSFQAFLSDPQFRQFLNSLE